MKKHRHKFDLKWVNGGTCGSGLLYICPCGTCREFKMKTAKVKRVIKAYEDLLAEVLKETK